MQPYRRTQAQPSPEVRPTCAATQLARAVDEQINHGARQEFADATSVTQESGADLGEGSAYLDDRAVEFTPQSVACGLCRGVAELSRDGSVTAANCDTTGLCEIEWAKKYPEKYRDLAQPGKWSICGAEIACSAVIAAKSGENGTVEPYVKNGICKLAFQGDNWQERRDDAVSTTPLVLPEHGIPRFDGAGSGREE
jgi:hypothetical protein